MVAFLFLPGFAQKIRMVPEKVVDSLQQKKEFQYANDPEYWKVNKPKTSDGFWESVFGILNSTAFRWVVYIFFIALFLFIIYRVLKVQGVFDRKNKKIAVTEEAHELADVPVDALEQKIREYHQAGKLREAVRYHYLHLLKLLALKNILTLKATSTNHDYVLQLSKTSLHADFSLLTNVYDHVWYGEIEPDAQQFSRIDSYFRKIKIGLSS
jgi:hypothetical protein